MGFRRFSVMFCVSVGLCTFVKGAFASIPPQVEIEESTDIPTTPSETVLQKKSLLKERLQKKAESQKSTAANSPPLFDLPVTYNHKVSNWISYYQGRGRKWFVEWLDRSTKYMPYVQKELRDQNLPRDLAYMVMIESGFEANATSKSDAVGPWQFIRSTAERYGLRINYWLDERRDLRKSTHAAVRYLQDLHREFGSWYLVAASYNMGENGLRRQIQRFRTKDFWELCRLGALPQETMDYVPKILAALMVTKTPALYGFNNQANLDPFEFDGVSVPGGTDLKDLADHLGLTHQAMKDLNAELLLGYVPKFLQKYQIKVPKGSTSMVAEYLQKTQ